MPITPIAALALLVAATLAAGLSALAARAQRRSAPTGPVPWWAALTVGLAYATGHAGVATPAFPPSDVTDRIPMLALSGAVVAVILSGDRGGSLVRCAASIALATLTWLALVAPILGADEIPRDTSTWLVATAVATWLAALNVSLLDTPSRRGELWAALAIYALGVGVVLVLANSAVLFQLGGVLSLVLAVSLASSRGLPVGGGIPAGLAVLTAMIVEGFVYAFLPTSAALVLAAGPAILWLTRLPRVTRLGPMLRHAIAIGLILIPVAVAIGLAMASKTSDASGY